MNQEVVIVLGMHRSGTSALAGSLEEAGLYLGHVVRASSDNPKGWCENPVIYFLHDSILRHNGGSPLAPPEYCRWRPNDELVRETLIDSFQGHPRWGFKDPRTLFTLEGWLEALPDAQLVGIFRHPLLVCESLARRDPRHAELGLEVWLKYNRRLLQWRARRQFPLLCFDDCVTPFEEQVRALAGFLRLPRAPVMTFYDEDHRHTRPEGELPLDDEIQETYQGLLKAHRDTLAQLGCVNVPTPDTCSANR